jgi:hypothetical protein
MLFAPKILGLKMTDPVLKNLTSPPKAGLHELYRWCDYIELRCLTHKDQRFSRDALAESIAEHADTSVGEAINEEIEEDLAEQVAAANEDDTATTNDRHEKHAASCFKNLRWREQTFCESWPFTLDKHAFEIRVKPELTEIQRFYLSLLLSASLSYVPKERWRRLTGLFEQASTAIMRNLMPKGSEVHPFGAAEAMRYTGHLFDRLTKLAKDVRGSLTSKRQHFAGQNSGDGGLDIVAWHGLGDDRQGIPIAFAQCGCTADGWPDKMLQASPASLAGKLRTLHEWATYYFMPLDLSTEIDDEMDWQRFHEFGSAIIIDRLRFIRLASTYNISSAEITAESYVDEACAMRLS